MKNQSEKRTRSTGSVSSICQNCKKDFTIESEDFNFYERVEVPPPTFCPECRIVRRMSFLNDRNFHKRKCGKTGEMCVSLFPQDFKTPVYSPKAWWADDWDATEYGQEYNFYKRKCGKTGEMCVSLFPQDFKTPVYSPKAWWADDWDATEYGQEYDFSKPFFKQFKELMDRVPQFAMQSQYTTLINSEYTMMGTYNRNCFMVTNTEYSTECVYTTFTSYGNNCLDVYMCHNSELCYQCINVRRCSRVVFSMDCEDCFDIAFSKNLRGCNSCFGCFNLHKKSYCFFNEQLSKEEYKNKLKECDTGSERVVKELLDRFEKESLKYPRKFMEGIKNVNVSGNYLYESKNAFG